MLIPSTRHFFTERLQAIEIRLPGAGFRMSTHPFKVKEEEKTLNSLMSQDRYESFERLLVHELTFPATAEAFSVAHRYLDLYFQHCLDQGEFLRADLKLLAVGMTFSWEFITQRIPQLLRKYPSAEVNLEILVVNPKFLKKLPISKDNIPWKKRCQLHLREIQRLQADPIRHQNRLRIQIKKYNNLPCWHGILMNNRHLFLGRVNWKFERDLPELTVGQNPYRHYGSGNPKANDRIQLFLNWFRYYNDYASKHCKGK
jgi:hypothetical protein